MRPSSNKPIPRHVLWLAVLAFGCQKDPPAPSSVAVEDTTPVPLAGVVVGDGGMSVSMDGGAPSTGPSPYGLPCGRDDDCEAGLFCITPDSDTWLGGGAANGYCSEECTTDADACTRRNTNSVCLLNRRSNRSYCFSSCVLGHTSKPKCHERSDLTCLGFGLVNGCVPLCGADSQCPEGRYCEPVNGVCVADRPEGDPVGTECDPAQNECTGRCAGLANGSAVCSGNCTLGADVSCGVATDELQPGDPACAVFNPLYGPGDIAICVQTCSCDADCDHPLAYCGPAPYAPPGSPLFCLFDDRPDGGSVTCDVRDEAPDASVE